MPENDGTFNSIEWHSHYRQAYIHTMTMQNSGMNAPERPNVSIYVDIAVTSFIVCSRSQKLRRKILLWAR